MEDYPKTNREGLLLNELIQAMTKLIKHGSTAIGLLIINTIIPFPVLLVWIFTAYQGFKMYQAVEELSKGLAYIFENVSASDEVLTSEDIINGKEYTK